jgi:hypothetical protein
VAARNFTQVLSKFNDFLISRFDVSKATIWQKLDSSYLEYVEDIMTKSFHQIFEGATTEEIEKIMKAILPMLYCSVQIWWDQEPPIFLSS